jgi:hypothetical protein
MTAVRVVPPTSKDASWRPGVYAPSDVELAAGAVDGVGAEDGAVEDGDEDRDSADELPELPDEHPAASAPIAATTPMATPRRRPLMPSVSARTCAGPMTPA